MAFLSMEHLFKLSPSPAGARANAPSGQGPSEHQFDRHLRRTDPAPPDATTQATGQDPPANRPQKNASAEDEASSAEKQKTPAHDEKDPSQPVVLPVAWNLPREETQESLAPATEHAAAGLAAMPSSNRAADFPEPAENGELPSDAEASESEALELGTRVAEWPTSTAELDEKPAGRAHVPEPPPAAQTTAAQAAAEQAGNPADGSPPVVPHNTVEEDGSGDPPAGDLPQALAADVAADSAPARDETAKRRPARDGKAAEPGRNDPQKGGRGPAPHNPRDGHPPVHESAPATGVAERPSEVSAPSLAPAEQLDLPQAEGSAAQEMMPQPTTPAAGGPGIASPAMTAPDRLSPPMLSRPSETASAEPALNQADQARFIQRVARAFQAAGDQGGELRLRLSPPELGALRLEVKVQDGAMTARLEAETSMAQSVLQENLPLLRERLAEQGIRIDQFDIELMERQPEGSPDKPADHQQRESYAAPQSPRGRSGERASEEPETSQARVRSPADSQLNVVV